MKIMLLFTGLLIMTTHTFATQALHIFTAAGTAPAMKEISNCYTMQTGTPILFNFANAGILAKQITAGAEFDIFLSANEKWMDYVVEQKAIDRSSRFVLLENEMVVIVPKGRSTQIDLTQPFKGRFATGDQATPLGIYARQAFMKLHCWKSLEPHLCVGDSVNKTLNYVALGEADAGVVFRSVAYCASNEVDIAYAIPRDLHAPIHFPVAASCTASPEALHFLQFLQSPQAQVCFEKYGWKRFVSAKPE